MTIGGEQPKMVALGTVVARAGRRTLNVQRFFNGASLAEKIPVVPWVARLAGSGGPLWRVER